MGFPFGRSAKKALCFWAAIATLSGVTLGAQTKLASREKQSKIYEESCVGNLRALNVAQVTYQGGDPTKGYARTLRELGPAGVGYLDEATVSGKKDGYRFKYIPEQTKGTQLIEHYTITARPIKRLVKNQKSFYTDETGLIRFATEDRVPTIADTPLDDPSKYPPRIP